MGGVGDIVVYPVYLVNIVPEAQIEPETETRPEPEIPAPQVSTTTCEGGLEAARPSTIEIASSYTTADIPEVVATFSNKEVTAGFPTVSQTTPPHSCLFGYTHYFPVQVNS